MYKTMLQAPIDKGKAEDEEYKKYYALTSKLVYSYLLGYLQIRHIINTTSENMSLKYIPPMVGSKFGLYGSLASACIPGKLGNYPDYLFFNFLFLTLDRPSIGGLYPLSPEVDNNFIRYLYKITAQLRKEGYDRGSINQYFIGKNVPYQGGALPYFLRHMASNYKDSLEKDVPILTDNSPYYEKQIDFLYKLIHHVFFIYNEMYNDGTGTFEPIIPGEYSKDVIETIEGMVDLPPEYLKYRRP